MLEQIPNDCCSRRTRNQGHSGTVCGTSRSLNMACSTISTFIRALQIRMNSLIHSIPGSSLARGILPLPNPHQIDPAHARIGIQSTLAAKACSTHVDGPPITIVDWADHGICGRGVLLDLVSYQSSLSPNKVLPYEYVVDLLHRNLLTICYQVRGPRIQLA